MKKYLLLFTVLIVSLSSCKKYDVDKQNSTDDALIQSYLKTNNITATKDPSGVYYQVVTAGTGNAYPSSTSAVNVSYVGTELDGTIFDQSLNTTILLAQSIKGWQIGVPKVTTGGEIKLFIPSSLAYGNEQTGVLKKNTVLIFDIHLFNFSN